MTVDAYDAARFLSRVLALTGAGRLLSSRDHARSRPADGIRAVIRNRALRPMVRRLAASPTAEHQDIATTLDAAIEAEDDAAALALVSTAGRRPDLRAEKMVSRRYGFLWICNPKVASRSIITALRAVDPDAELIRGRTLDEILAARPEITDYTSFAFLRHPCHRTYSFYADKHVLALRDRDAYGWFIAPYYGAGTGMSFGELCRWLNTPCGSDAFADRHWLSQHRQLRFADGRLPDFVGSYERLDADWRTITERLRMPFRELPRLNARPEGVIPTAHPDENTVALLGRRYADDFRIGGYDPTTLFREL